MPKNPHRPYDSHTYNQQVPHVTRQYFNKLVTITKIIKKKSQKSMQTQKMLERYLAQFNQNKSNNADTYICKTCNKSFKGRAKYAGHCKTHKTIVSCDQGRINSSEQNIECKVKKLNDENNKISMMNKKEESGKEIQSEKSRSDQIFQDIYEENEFLSEGMPDFNC